MFIFNYIMRFKRFNYKTQKGRENMISLVNAIGIILNTGLSFLKITIGYLSGSITIVADGVNNLYDAGSAIISIIGVKLSNIDADDGHPYGHGRIEYIAAFTISLLIIMMGLNFIKDAIVKLLNPNFVEFNISLFFVLLLSIFIKMYMTYYNRRLGKKLNSSSLIAVGHDSFSDCIVTFFILCSMLSANFMDLNIDGIVGIFVSLFIIYTGIKSAGENFHLLVGSAPHTKTINKLENFIVNETKFIGIHNIVVHDYGPGRLMMTMNVEFNDDFDKKQIFIEQEKLEREIKNKFGYEVFIKFVPVIYARDDENIAKVAQKIQEAIKDYGVVSNFRQTNDLAEGKFIFDIDINNDSIKGFKVNTSDILKKRIKVYYPNHGLIIKCSKHVGPS